MPLQAPKIKKEPFKWLFRAHFADGSIIQQDQDDKSLTRTDGTGSCFTDVLASPHELIAFELINQDDNHALTLDLKTGAFVINGVPFIAHNQNFDPSKYHLDLVYFRETRVDREIKGVVKDDMSVGQEDINVRHYVNRYFIGWKTIVNGKSKQVTVAVG